LLLRIETRIKNSFY